MSKSNFYDAGGKVLQNYDNQAVSNIREQMGDFDYESTKPAFTTG